MSENADLGVSITDFGVKGAQYVEALPRIQSVLHLWGGMSGNILVIAPILSPATSNRRLEEAGVEGDEKASFLKATERLQRSHGPLQFYSDVTGEHFVLRTLDFVYGGSALLKICRDEKMATQPEKMADANIVCIGGPIANRVTETVLTKWDQMGTRRFPFNRQRGLNSLSEPKESPHHTHFSDDATRVLRDYGLAIRDVNPFDPTGKKTAIVLAGCSSYGTQAAAAILSIADCAAEIEKEIRKEEHFQSTGFSSFSLICQVKSKEEGQPLDMMNLDSLVKVVEPFQSKREYANDTEVKRTTMDLDKLAYEPCAAFHALYPQPNYRFQLLGCIIALCASVWITTTAMLNTWVAIGVLGFLAAACSLTGTMKIIKKLVFLKQ